VKDARAYLIRKRTNYGIYF